MKKTITIFGILLFLFCSININAQKINLLPEPQNLKWGKSKFSVAGAKLLVTRDLSLREKNSIAQFIAFVKNMTGLSLPIIYTENPNERIIVLNSGQSGPALPVVNEKLGKQSREAYRLTVTTKRVQITAANDAGIYYGLQTLRQLILGTDNNCYIPEVAIDDYPVFAFRGVMMDFSHGGLLTEEEIKKQIDFLSRWKVNQYYFYNEVSIELKGYPLINYNACYSQEIVKRIIAYARERHMDVIPFMNFYGHLHELLRVEKYTGLGIGNYGHDLDPNDSKVQILLKNWIKQYAALFQSPFIHIGFDETWETERLAMVDSTIRPKELYLKQIDFVTKTIREYGKTMMVWTDISRLHPEVISRFPNDLIPVIWEYSDQQGSISKWLKPVPKDKPFFIQSGVDNWGNVYTAANYTFDNIDLCLKASRDEKALGYITSVWTDAVQPLLRNTWLFMAYGSVGAWQKNPMDRDEFIDNYCQYMYPGAPITMNNAFRKMAESEAYLAKGLGRHTQTEMWANPFSLYHLKNTKEHLADYKNARIAAETAIENLMEALSFPKADTAFIKTLLVNSRMLDYTAQRFIWARTIVDRWNWIFDYKTNGRKDPNQFYDIDNSTHGLTTDMMDICTEIKEEYREAWLSENMKYRLGNMTGRFDTEYLLWRNMYTRIADYNNRNNIIGSPIKFEDIFLK